MKKYAFGVDIGGTTIKMGFFTTSGELLDTWEIVTRIENNGANILEDISNSIKEKMSEKNISKDDVEGIGLGVPGPVGADGTVYRCVNLGWEIINVVKRLESLTGFKVKAGNDANVAALGEMWQGGGRGYDSIVMVTLGTGIGGGVIIDGHIIPGSNGAAGEIGHIHVNDNETEVCGCGKKGCIEQYASANGIVRVAKRYLEEHKDDVTSLRDVDRLTSKVIFEEAEKGDIVAVVVIQLVGEMLGKVLSYVASVVNPEAFVIGGGMSKAGPMLIETIKKYFRLYSFHATTETEFKLAELENAAGIYGAAKMVVD